MRAHPKAANKAIHQLKFLKTKTIVSTGSMAAK